MHAPDSRPLAIGVDTSPLPQWFSLSRHQTRYVDLTVYMGQHEG